MNSNGIITIVEDKNKVGCVLLDENISFYVQLAYGWSSQTLTPAQNLCGKITLKLEESVLENLYIMFCCSVIDWNPRQLIGYTIENNHVFQLLYNVEKKEYCAIFGNEKNEHQLQILRTGEYYCYFILLQKLDIDNRFKMIYNYHTCNQTRSGHVISNPFILNIIKN